MRLKRTIGIAVYLIVISVIVWQTYNLGFLNEQITYFTKEPKQLLWGVGVGIIGGLALWILSRLPKRLRYLLRLFFLSISAVGSTTFAVGFLCLVFVFPSSTLDYPPDWQNALAVLGQTGAACFLWVRFLMLLKLRKRISSDVRQTDMTAKPLS